MSKRKIWLIVTPMILFIMLAIFVKAGLSVNFEGWAYSEAVEDMSPGVTSLIKFVTHIGDATVIISFCLALFLLSKTRKTIAIPVSVTVILSAVLNTILKHAFARERPDILRLINETSYSFPSGHSMNNAALYTILTLLAFYYIKSIPKKIFLSCIFVALTISIGFTRVYLGVHYAGDVIGGWLLGFTVALSVYFWWGKKLDRGQIDGV